MKDFDPAAYWRDRLDRHPDLQGTGTSFMPVAWQRWLYRAKERAYRGLLAENRVSVAGAAVLNFGCGTGFFEDVWERAGARTVAGVDIVASTIGRLSDRYPRRRYICADLASDPGALDGLPPMDLVTAIDVVYHVVADDALERTLEALLRALRPGGHVLFSDALVDDAPQPHVRFRGLAWWRTVLARQGMQLVARRPVAVLHNRPSRLFRLAPGLAGAALYYADAALLRIAPALANNWVVLGRKQAA